MTERESFDYLVSSDIQKYEGGHAEKYRVHGGSIGPHITSSQAWPGAHQFTNAIYNFFIVDPYGRGPRKMTLTSGRPGVVFSECVLIWISL